MSSLLSALPAPGLPPQVRLLVGPGVPGGLGVPPRGGSLPAAEGRPGAATIAEVLEALRTPGVVHLDCHGVASLDAPLDSAVLLADGPLTLARLLAEDVRARLVVMAACETAMSGTALPDEAVNLPSGFLQAGAAAAIGVVHLVASVTFLGEPSGVWSIWACPDLHHSAGLTRGLHAAAVRDDSKR